MIDIEKTREELGLTIAQMSRAMGVHRNTYYKWEKEIHKPDNSAIKLMKMIVWLNNKNLLNEFMKL